MNVPKEIGTSPSGDCFFPMAQAATPAETSREAFAMEGSIVVGSIYTDGIAEALRHKWIESERARRDLGEFAIRQWEKDYWPKYVRARWLEHIEGIQFWKELDRGDFGLLKRLFHEQTVLLDRILDRLKAGQENLDIICWAIDWGIPVDPVIQILELLDINSRRLKFHAAGEPDVL
jgi:hypothetical protein